MDIGIRAIDRQGIIIYCNDVIAEITGHTSEHMLGKHILEIHKDLDSESSTLLKCMESGKGISNKIKIQTGEQGELVYLVTTNIPIFQDGEIVGAIEYVKTEDSYGDLLKLILDKKYSEQKLKRYNSKSSIGYTFADFLTIEKDMISLIEKIKNMSIYDYNVLICGETGTGKEIIAQSIHNLSPRRNNIFLAQNCAAIPENLLESLFFGTESGSFTGATDKKGLFEQANGGTLLLDELNSLPIFLQAKLLRVLQEGYIRRIGGKKDIKVDVRVICTTNEKISVLIEENRFRRDLFYRLGPIHIEIPSLRDRKADIDYLTRIFLKRESKSMKIKEPNISIKVKEVFRNYPWPGNVRELKSLLCSILLSHPGIDIIELEHLPSSITENIWDLEYQKLEMGNLNYDQRITKFEEKIINDALDATKGNVSEAAKILGIKRTTLQYKINKFKLK
jgi:arginine utilization regulatory protein